MSMLNIIFSFVICITLSIISGAIQVPLKCNVKDVECKKQMYQSMIKQAIDGDPSTNIPKSDPMTLDKVTFTLTNSFKLTLDEGIATGFKACNFVQYNTFLEPYVHTTLNLTCDVDISGLYTVEVPKSVLMELGGEDVDADVVSGSEKGKVDLQKMRINLDFPFEFVWKDKDAYLHVKDVYIENIPDTIVFSVDNLDVGNKLNAEKVTTYINKHATEFNFIAPVSDGVRLFFQAFLGKYVGSMPAKNFYSDV